MTRAIDPEWDNQMYFRVDLGRNAAIMWHGIDEIDFPITETSKYLEVEKQVYDVVVRRAEVVHIDPQGELGPFYQRDHYHSGVTRWRKLERFVPFEELM